MKPLLTTVLALALAPHAAASASPFDRVFERLYNCDFPASNRLIDQIVASAPGEPLGYSIRAAVLLFQEMNRLEILHGEFFASDKRIAEKKKLKADPEVRRRLLESVLQARTLAGARLVKDPNDREALFALTMATGVATDYTSFIEKKLWSSMTTLRESHGYALRLLRIDKSYYDAYLTTGLTEYLVGSLPFFVRWFVRFEETKGNKDQAVRNLQLVAQKGRYYGPFAKLVLAVIHLREKRPLESERLLIELARDYPENPLIRKELAKLAELNRKGAEEGQGR